MMVSSIIIATKTIANSSRPVATLKIAGISLLERQIRLLINNNVNDFFIVSSKRSKELDSEVARLKKLKKNIHVITADNENNIFLSIKKHIDVTPATHFFLTDCSSIIDSRLPEFILKEGKEGICILSESALTINRKLSQSLSYNNRQHVFAGIALFAKGTVERIQFDNNLSEELQHLIESNLNMVIDLSKVDSYVRSMRRDLPFFLFPVGSARDNAEIKGLLLWASQKNINEWPVEFIWKPVENFIIFRICELPISPNQITLVSHISSCIAIYLFATGQYFNALIIALIVGLLDGLDGKQARVKGMTTKFGDIFDHVFDRVNEYSWFFAMSYFLFKSGYGNISWILLASFLFAYLIEWPLLTKFKKHFGVLIEDMGPFERRFRLFAGRRETYIWTLIPFILYDVFFSTNKGLFYGFLTITIYGILTVFLRSYRCLFHLARSRRARHLWKEGTNLYPDKQQR